MSECHAWRVGCPSHTHSTGWDEAPRPWLSGPVDQKGRTEVGLPPVYLNTHPYQYISRKGGHSQPDDTLEPPKRNSVLRKWSDA